MVTLSVPAHKEKFVLNFGTATLVQVGYDIGKALPLCLLLVGIEGRICRVFLVNQAKVRGRL